MVDPTPWAESLQGLRDLWGSCPGIVSQEGPPLPPGHGVDESPCAQPTLMSQLTTLCPVSLPSKPWLGERSRQMLFLQAWKRTRWEHPNDPGRVPGGRGPSSAVPVPRGVALLTWGV